MAPIIQKVWHRPVDEGIEGKLINKKKNYLILKSILQVRT
jgi:hypothetical protein